MLKRLHDFIVGINERNWQVGLVIFAVVLAGIVSSIALGVTNWRTAPAQDSLPFPDFEPKAQVNIHSGSLVLYRDFVMAESINPGTIVKNSYRIKLNGKIASGRLYVQASATNRGYDQDRVHSIYFYIDDDRTGGHLGATRQNSTIVSGGFTIRGGGKFKDNFDLNNVPVAFGVDGKQYLRIVDVLNDGMPHYVDAFVSTGVFGSLDELRIDYVCADTTPNCSLAAE